MKNNRLQIADYRLEKKNFLRLCGVFIFCVFLVTGCVKKEIRNIGSEGKNILCFGDSITFGYGANPGEDYPAVMSKLIDIPVINAGIDGDTTIEALKRVDSDVLDRKPLLVIIEFGGNDFLRKIPREVTLNNVIKMVDKIQAKGAMVAIVDISAGMLLEEYHKVFNKLAREKSAIFIPDILRGIITNPKLKSDFLHPNSEGYKIIAQRIHSAILPYLKKNSVINNSKK